MRRRTQLPLLAAVACALIFPALAGGARHGVPAKLLGVWHKTMTHAQWERAGVARDVGVYTFVVKKAGTVTVYKPGGYQAGCSACADFTTTFSPVAARVTLGNVPVCSFKGVYSWRLTGATLVLTPTADPKCVVRATFLGGRWKR
jgi:hypothetical protein